MAGTREMLQSAGDRNRMKGSCFRSADEGNGSILPPVCPMPAVQATAEKKVEAPQRRRVVAQPIRENSVYRQLMRSHDRMHTRHLNG